MVLCQERLDPTHCKLRPPARAFRTISNMNGDAGGKGGGRYGRHRIPLGREGRRVHQHIFLKPHLHQPGHAFSFYAQKVYLYGGVAFL